MFHIFLKSFFNFLLEILNLLQNVLPYSLFSMFVWDSLFLFLPFLIFLFVCLPNVFKITFCLFCFVIIFGARTRIYSIAPICNKNPRHTCYRYFPYRNALQNYASHAENKLMKFKTRYEGIRIFLTQLLNGAFLNLL